jgi:hypothetical protein
MDDADIQAFIAALMKDPELRAAVKVFVDKGLAPPVVYEGLKELARRSAAMVH